MTVPIAAPPSSIELQRLWSQFHLWHPRSLWLGLLPCHRIEAQVCRKAAVPLDPWTSELLRAISERKNLSPAELGEILGVPLEFLGAVLKKLRWQGLISGSNHGSWSTTGTGMECVRNGALERSSPMRSVFHFCEGTYRGLPAYLHRANAEGGVQCAANPAGWQFSARFLQQCIDAPDDWKQKTLFPRDIVQMAHCEEFSETAVTSWENIILHHAVQVPVAIIDAQRCLGFALQEKNWQVSCGAALFQLASISEAGTFIGRPLSEPTLEEWRDSWEVFRRPLGLPRGEILRYEKTDAGPRLRIRCSTNALSKHSELSESACWLSAGSPQSFRCAALAVFEE